MRVVLDTNILLSSLKRGGRNRPIFDGVREGRFALLVSTEILLEYTEIISQQTTPEIGYNVTQLLINLARTERVNVSYRFNLITVDPDDNKFVDVAIAGGAELLVTNDRHFGELQQVEWPRVRVVDDATFINLLSQMTG